MTRRLTWGTFIIISLGLLLGAWQQWVYLGLTEVLGFITGAACVLLVVEENIWNFPIGIANSVFFIFLFLNTRLYGDMVLQGIYIILGFHGWYMWLFGGERRTHLHVARVSFQEWIILAGVGALATFGLTSYFYTIHDAAPFLDGLTTVLSLVAQYLLNTKRVENWWIWITADVIYIGLYIYKGLYLTSLLYAIFIIMCIAGFRAWQRSYHETKLLSASVVEGGAE